jgi:hypothetical protein
MWIVGHRNLPYAGHDINTTIESYHSNLKATLRASKGRAHGRRLDWVIYELTGEILSHYWYQAIKKQHGFVPNLKLEQFVINAVLKAREIPDNCVTLPIANDGPTLVTSMNDLASCILCTARTVNGVVAIACGHLRATYANIR